MNLAPLAVGHLPGKSQSANFIHSIKQTGNPNNIGPEITVSRPRNCLRVLKIRLGIFFHSVVGINIWKISFVYSKRNVEIKLK